MNTRIALIGNPNSGKTTLFNLLTESRGKVGNWSGVTTDKKEAPLKTEKSVTVVDLPGVYSLSARSEDEKAVTEYLKKTPPNVIINVVDGTNLERNLYLTEKVKTLGIPMIVAVNMADELMRSGINLNAEKLSSDLGVPITLISAKKKKGIDKLLDTALNLKTPPEKVSYSLTDRKIYEKIERILDGTLTKKPLKSEKFTQKADRIITHRIWGLPIFALIMTTVYYLSLSLGGKEGNALSDFFVSLGQNVKYFLISVGLPQWATGFITDGVLKGVFSVLSFLPQILVLFFCLSILEESGYMARVSFIFDRIFRNVGLGGKSVIPLVLSCGCTVTGVMATRTIENRNERFATIFLCPFMPCGAKTAVFAYFSSKLFGGNPFVAVMMYFIGISAVVIFGKALTKLKVFKGENAFILEIPPLRLPTVSGVFNVLIDKTVEFIVKAGTVIFGVSVVLWLLGNFGTGGYLSGEIEKSFLFFFGNVLKYLFYPLGFGNWQASVSILSGVLAKEAVMESLSVLTADVGSIFFNKFSVVAFMTFVLLSPPCIAALTQIKRELKSTKAFLLMLAFQTAAAYICALIINLGGLVFYSFPHLLSVIVFVIMVITVTIKISGKGCGGNCSACRKERRCRDRKNRNTTI